MCIYIYISSLYKYSNSVDICILYIYTSPQPSTAAASPSKALLVRMAAWPASKLGLNAWPNDSGGVMVSNPIKWRLNRDKGTWRWIIDEIWTDFCRWENERNIIYKLWWLKKRGPPSTTMVLVGESHVHWKMFPENKTLHLFIMDYPPPQPCFVAQSDKSV